MSNDIVQDVGIKIFELLLSLLTVLKVRTVLLLGLLTVLKVRTAGIIWQC
jgi:hypothetical protein